MEEKDSAVLSEAVQDPEVSSSNVEAGVISEEIRPFSGAENNIETTQKENVEEGKEVAAEQPVQEGAKVAEPVAAQSPELNYVDKLILY